MADQPGQQLGNYRLLRLLGQGGFADVYLGQHIHLDSQAAIKVLQVRLVGSALEQFRDEGRTIASLLHPNIVRVFDFGVENDTPYLVMDFAPNGSLRQRYAKGTMQSPATILPHLTQVARALQYAHDRKLIHRDVKPENMLLGPTNEVLLSDFGLVLHVQSTGSQTTREMAGTLPYMAPEQITGKPRPASDQYALGIVLYEWLSGDRPFHGSLIEIATQHLMTPPAPLYGRVPGMTLALQEVVFTALAKDFQQRFANMEAFATAFEQACRIAPRSSFSLASGADSAQQTLLNPSASNGTLPNQSQQPSSIKSFLDESQQSTYIHPLASQPQQSTVIHTPSNASRPASLNPPVTSSREPTRTPTSSKLSPQPALIPPVSPDAGKPQKPPKRSISGGRVMLSAGLALLVIMASLAFFLIARNQQIATDNASATETARATILTTTAQANATTTAQANATTTARANVSATMAAAQTATAIARQPYSAPIPGPGCDHGGASWNYYNYHKPNYVPIQCLSDALLLTQNSGVIFEGRGTFPANYSTSVEVSHIQQSACPDLLLSFSMRGSWQGDFSFEVCWDGSVAVGRYDPPPDGQRTGTPYTHYYSGSVPVSAVFLLEVVHRGTSCVFSINGSYITSVSYSKFSQGNAITLQIDYGQGTSYSAQFKNFVFSPLF